MPKRRDAFAAIADPTRRRILDLLHERGPLPAGDVAEHFESAARPGISRHLRVLREARLVEVASEGRNRVYHLDPRPLAAIRDGWLAGFGAIYQDGLSALRRRVEEDD